MSHWRPGQKEAILAAARARGMMPTDPPAPLPSETLAKQYDHHPDNPRTAAAMERDPCNESLAASQVQKGADGRILVRVTSVRKRLADEDGLCEKFVVDCCRYAGLIPDDAPGVCKIETAQRKAAKGESEKTEITIIYP